MPFEKKDDEDEDWEKLLEDVSVPEPNMYIADNEKAVELISMFIKNAPDSSSYFKKKIEDKVNRLFSLFSEVTIDGEMVFYERFMDLCSHFSERQKIRKIQDKVVISFGGAVSAGKSRFINTISGIGDRLPVDQKTTTAIPTYIIKSSRDFILANSVYGYSVDISSEELNAMAHEFDNVYHIGFSPFVDSIIVETKEYNLPDEIALLDTPGYTKYDENSDSKMVISDRQKAHEQLSVSDYLVWLIDIDGGTITQDDIQFIESLRVKTPILIVFTKADLKENRIGEIVAAAGETIKNTSINCFGITAYSSEEKKEYGGDKIKEFLDYTVRGNVRNSDIVGEFKRVEADMREAINRARNQSKSTADNLFSYISKSDKIMGMQSLAALWGKANQNRYKLDKLLRNYEEKIEDINVEIEKYFMGGYGDND